MPYVEVNGQMANLDVTPDFTAAAPVISGGSGPFHRRVSGRSAEHRREQPRPAPRRGLSRGQEHDPARRLQHHLQQRVVRVIATAARRAAAVCRNRNGHRHRPTAPLTLADALLSSTSATTNNFGVDRDYALGTIQTWNARRSAVNRQELDDHRRLHGHEGHQPRHPAGAQSRAARPADSRRSGVHLGIVGRPFDSATRRTSRFAGASPADSAAALSYTLARSMDNASSLGAGAPGRRAERQRPRVRMGAVELRPAPPGRRAIFGRAAVRTEPPLAQERRPARGDRRRMDGQL